MYQSDKRRYLFCTLNLLNKTLFNVAVGGTATLSFHFLSPPQQKLGWRFTRTHTDHTKPSKHAHFPGVHLAFSLGSGPRQRPDLTFQCRPAAEDLIKTKPSSAPPGDTHSMNTNVSSPVLPQLIGPMPASSWPATSSPAAW